jgi:hypothetical protein
VRPSGGQGQGQGGTQGYSRRARIDECLSGQSLIILQQLALGGAEQQARAARQAGSDNLALVIGSSPPVLNTLLQHLVSFDVGGEGYFQKIDVKFYPMIADMVQGSRLIASSSM